MTRLLDLNEESQIATFGPGTPGPMVEAQLAAKGYVLGHFPQSFELSTIGGWVASRSSGQQSLRYGRIEQMFAGGRLETFDGTMTIPTIPASSAGAGSARDGDGLGRSLWRDFRSESAGHPRRRKKKSLLSSTFRTGTAPTPSAKKSPRRNSSSPCCGLPTL